MLIVPESECAAVPRSYPSVFTIILDIFPDEVSIPFPGSYCLRLCKDKVVQYAVGITAGCTLGLILHSMLEEQRLNRESKNLEATPFPAGGRRLGGGDSLRIPTGPPRQTRRGRRNPPGGQRAGMEWVRDQPPQRR